MTPEGRVKGMVNRRLQGLRPHLYKFMPVQNGMGAPALDYYCCYVGTFFAIETKKPKGIPTPRQWITMKEINRAGGLVFLVRDQTDMDYLIACLLDQRGYGFLDAVHYSEYSTNADYGL